MSNDGLFTDGSDKFAPKVDAIPLSDVDTSKAGEASIGQLVSNATEQISSLIRSEVELAKTELAESAKKGGIGAGLFGAAGTIALYSTFFFFCFLAALLAIWLPLWAGFLIVFAIMILIAGGLAMMGLKQVKQVKKPEKTIESVQELKQLKPGKAQRAVEKTDHGLYT
ncbi:phage holin family protein [Corynebacterium massiliense]|uniref:Phage holin family protein n=1 Tax=Corynebacterium massiliense DSM 45435 TaxID=1121364 RepID=A0ABY7U5J3_9CORY|nr:phage holin family protein [Corynebacterium massiliense]WCZ31661.1 hypothetical protein CMASS_00985 [Corynebacterium massiliense DSM 45435]